MGEGGGARPQGLAGTRGRTRGTGGLNDAAPMVCKLARSEFLGHGLTAYARLAFVRMVRSPQIAPTRRPHKTTRSINMLARLGGRGGGMLWLLARLALVRLRELDRQAKPMGRHEGHAIQTMPQLHRHFAAEAPLVQCLQKMCKHLPCLNSVRRAMSLVALHK